MAASSNDLLSFLNQFSSAPSQSTGAPTEDDIFIDFYVRLEELIIKSFFPVETSLWGLLGGSSVEINKIKYTAPTYVAKIYVALKQQIYDVGKPSFDVTSLLTLVNEKVEDLYHSWPFGSNPDPLTILFYRQLACILNTCYTQEVLIQDGQSRVEYKLQDLAILSAWLRALLPVLDTIKRLYAVFNTSDADEQRLSLEDVLVETPQVSTSLNLSGVLNEQNCQAIAYLLLANIQLTELDVTGIVPTSKVEEALRIIRCSSPDVTIKGVAVLQSRASSSTPITPSVVTAMGTPGVGKFSTPPITVPNSVSFPNQDANLGLQEPNWPQSP